MHLEGCLTLYLVFVLFCFLFCFVLLFRFDICILFCFVLLVCYPPLCFDLLFFVLGLWLLLLFFVVLLLLCVVYCSLLWSVDVAVVVVVIDCMFLIRETDRQTVAVGCCS